MKYGLRISDIGILFTSRQDRDKAMLTFTSGAVVAISECAGPRYSDAKAAFSVFEYQPGEAVINCHKCKGQFSPESCSRRAVPRTDYMGMFTKKGEHEEKWVCDACLATILRDFEVWQAQQTLKGANDD